jgi:hypothetical protein
MDILINTIPSYCGWMECMELCIVMGVPPNGWFTIGYSIKWMIWGTPMDWKPPYGFVGI